MDKLLFEYNGPAQVTLRMREEGVVFDYFSEFDSNSHESDAFRSPPFPVSLFREGINE